MRNIALRVVCLLLMILTVPLHSITVNATNNFVLQSTLIFNHIPNAPSSISHYTNELDIYNATINIDFQVTNLLNGKLKIESETDSFTPFYITTNDTVQLYYSIFPYNTETIHITFIPINNTQYGYCCLYVNIC